MRCLVTGSRGFLGSKVIVNLRAYGICAIGISREQGLDCLACDLENPKKTKEVILGVRPDWIIHCAAVVPKTALDYENKENAKRNLRMLESVLQGSNCPVALVSSMTVYPKDVGQPVREEEADSGSPSCEYGKGKFQAEQRLRNDGRPGLAIRIPGLFGPDRRSGIVYNLINAIKTGEKPVLPKKPMVWAGMDVSDAAKWIVKLICCECKEYESVNLAYPSIYSVNRLVSVVGEIFKKDLGYSVNHPDFQFDLGRLWKKANEPLQTLKESIVNLVQRI